MESLAGIDNGDGVFAAYVNRDDGLEFSRPLPAPSKTRDKRTGGVEHHHVAGTCVRNDDSTIREELGTLYALKSNIVPTTHDRP